MTADVELLPLPEWTKRDDLGGLVPSQVRAGMRDYARANLAPLQAENERLRAEVETGDTNLAAAMSAVAELEARADRLAEALREAVGELASIGDAIGHDHPEARRIFTLRANLLSARFAALAKEDRNG